MKTVPTSSIHKWQNINAKWVPTALDMKCHACKQPVSFAILADPRGSVWDNDRDTMSFTSQCPRCRERTSVWVVQPKPSHDARNQQPACIAVYPPSSDDRKPVEGIESLPEALKREYSSALKVYNSGASWEATVTLCRRTLEGIVQNLVPAGSKGTLASSLRDLPSKVDLGKPITSLADSLRMGGNIGAHYDPGVVLDEPFARRMLDIVEYLLEYFYTLPKMIDDAKTAIDSHK